MFTGRKQFEVLERTSGPVFSFKPIIKGSLRWVVTAARWASNTIYKEPARSRRSWNNKLPTELAFWEKWVATKGLGWPEDFRKRTDPAAEIEPAVARFVVSKNDRLLDVGAGPLTFIGTRWNGYKMDVTAVDPLADAYNELLDRYGITAPVRSQSVAAEELGSRFPPNTFDLSVARNCLDHSYDPYLAIEQMLLVTKREGKIVLIHEVNEGSNELYRGLHQWNFVQRKNDFLISAPGRGSFNVSRRLEATTNVSAATEGGWITVVIQKK